MAVKKMEDGTTKWSRETPTFIFNKRQYMLARIDNEGEKPLHLVIVKNTEDGILSIMTRADGKTPVRIAKASDFAPFMEAFLAR